jgi:hypothetical protein
MQLPHEPCREHRFPVSPLLRVKNLLPSNGRGLQGHYLATGLHATTETHCIYCHVIVTRDEVWIGNWIY